MSVARQQNADRGTTRSIQALSVDGASKTFGSQRVLTDVDLQIEAGEIRALVGENGSGKSTLVKILAGYHIPDEGTTISVAGQIVAPHQPGACDTAGLRFVHQDLAVVGDLNTVENLGLGHGYGSRRGRAVKWNSLRRSAREDMAELGYDIDVDVPVANLESSERTAVAVARAVSARHSTPRVLVLDEPTANLPGPEVDRLFELVRRVSASGIAVLFVSHHLTEVFELADTVTVLRGGALMATRVVGDLTEDSLIELMVGSSVERQPLARKRAASPIVLNVNGLRGGSLRGIDFSVAAGEIVGVAGVTGSGRESVAPLVFGAINREGLVFVGGTALKPKRPDQSMNAGMAFIPSDRPSNAIIDGFDVAENLTIARPRDFVRRRILRRRLEYKAVSTWLRRLDVRPADPRQTLDNLSGGNAQKVILARWLRLEPTVMVLDEPTQGVDVGAREQIHQMVEEASSVGCAVLVCSTDSEELARLCDRVLVLIRGQVCSELTRPFHPDEVTIASLSSKEPRP